MSSEVGMFQLNSLISLKYQEFGQILDASGEQLYRKMMLALGVETDKELAQKLSISEQAVNNAKRHGKIPDRWLMYAVCHSGFALPLLLTLTDLELGRALTDQSRYAFKLVPVIKSLQDLRDGNYVKNITSYLALQKYELHRACAEEEELVALVMAEHALEPTIRPGDTVIISLTQRQFAQGGIFVVNLDDIQLLCRLNKLPSRFRIAFDNPQIKDFESETVDIRGRVLWISQAV
jgi:Peptidase S24-like/Bacteriophage CI repressor helix-turn-helix domain